MVADACAGMEWHFVMARMVLPEISAVHFFGYSYLVDVRYGCCEAESAVSFNSVIL